MKPNKTVMNMKKKIVISWATGVAPYFDFGLFKGSKKLQVSQEIWKKYVDARFAYEVIHKDLVSLALKKK